MIKIEFVLKSIILKDKYLITTTIAKDVMCQTYDKVMSWVVGHKIFFTSCQYLKWTLDGTLLDEHTKFTPIALKQSIAQKKIPN